MNTDWYTPKGFPKERINKQVKFIDFTSFSEEEKLQKLKEPYNDAIFAGIIMSLHGNQSGTCMLERFSEQFEDMIGPNLDPVVIKIFHYLRDAEGLQKHIESSNNIDQIYCQPFEGPCTVEFKFPVDDFETLVQIDMSVISLQERGHRGLIAISNTADQSDWWMTNLDSVGYRKTEKPTYWFDGSLDEDEEDRD